MEFKNFKFIIALALLVIIAACGNNGDAGNADPPANQADQNQSNDVDSSDIDVHIALISHSPESILDDGSFNQGAWYGIDDFITTHNLPTSNARFFIPHEGSDEVRLDLIEEAVNTGSNVLILPGHHFEAVLYDAQDIFPDTTFILLDASPRRDDVVRVESNVAAIHYAEEQAGFLAGYAAVLEGYRQLGFMGGLAVPAVVRFGHGFIQGAEHAAASLGLATGEVVINYMYLGGFAPEPAHTTTAAAWFASGTEVIFAAAGGAGASVMSAAESANAAVIGVDVDQSHLSDTVVISAVKGLAVSVYDMLTDLVNNNFDGGREHRFDASIDGVGLTMNTSLFTTFTQQQYESVFSTLATNEIEVNPSLEIGAILEMVTLVTVNEL